jgi:P-type Ca2+ transporter type 2B
MGGANNICSDKTGTLTMNKMTVTDIWAGRGLPVKVNDASYSFRDYFNNDKHTQLFTQALSCNTIGSIAEASATEQAMLNMVAKFGVDFEKERKEHLPEDYVRFHFTSKRKRMSTIIENVGHTEYGYDKRIHLKGASEIVLANCSYYLNQDGQKIDLQDEMKSNLLGIIADYAKQALRTICFAYKDLKQGEGGPTHEEMDEEGVIRAVEKSGFILIAIVGIKDIIRQEVPDAIAQCHRAGIVVRMVTGDNLTTAVAIAQECNILPRGTHIDTDCVLEGPEFYERMGGLICKTCKNTSPCDCPADKVDEGVRNITAFKSIWKSLRVLARSRPEDKYLLVTGLKEMGDTVAVTGDGTNDAPALKKADVGFAMGITGTDVAKHAADIIVMDDNFASIVKACMWGRNIYDNIRKFLQFQLSVNMVALVTAFIGSCILKESPLEPIQLLWVNMIMDSLGALALATE